VQHAPQYSWPPCTWKNWSGKSSRRCFNVSGFTSCFLVPCFFMEEPLPETCRRVIFRAFSILDAAGRNFAVNLSSSCVSMILAFLAGASVPPDAAFVLSAVPDWSQTISKSLSDSSCRPPLHRAHSHCLTQVPPGWRNVLVVSAYSMLRH
jgi:hypothetical protein